MRANGKRERGQTMVLAAIWLVAILAISAISIEVGHLTDTATEVQVAADAAAMAAAQNMITNRGDTRAAGIAAKAVASQNSTDGRAPASDEVNIEFGTYSTASGFTLGGVYPNAARATVAISNIKYIMASILGAGSSTTVTKQAVAAFTCTQTGQATAPVMIDACTLQAFTQGQTCSNGSVVRSFVVHVGEGCWANQQWFTNDQWLPTACPDGSGQGPVLSVGQTWSPAQHGTQPQLFQAFQHCLDHNVNSFVIPVVQCPLPRDCHNLVIQGFATIKVASVTPGGANSALNLEQICDNSTPGTGGNTGVGGCFASGNARLVQ